MDAFLAIYDDNIQALREYLELGDVNIKNERGMSLLHSAILFSTTGTHTISCISEFSGLIFSKKHK